MTVMMTTRKKKAEKTKQRTERRWKFFNRNHGFTLMKRGKRKKEKKTISFLKFVKVIKNWEVKEEEKNEGKEWRGNCREQHFWTS